jgi:hypothetical protein
MARHKTCSICKQSIKTQPIRVASNEFVCNAQCLKKYKTITKGMYKELYRRYY